MADQNVPVAFVPAARWGSTVSGTPNLINFNSWRRWDSSPSNTLNLYGDMWTKIVSVGGSVKGVIFHEAVNDINQVSDVQRANYKSQLNEFINDVMADFGVKTMFSLPGDCDPVLHYCDIVEGFDNVREVIQEVWDENSNAVSGAAFYDIDKTSPLGDGVHFLDDASFQTIANRIWVALRDEYYTATDARGPRLATAQYNAAKTDVYLTFTEDSLPILPASGAEGIKIYDDGVAATISSVNRTANNTLKVSLSSAASGTITVSICEYRDCYGQTVITDSSTYNLPVENVSGQSTSLLSDATSPTGTISINGGAASTNTTSVTLTLSATDDIDPSGSLQMQVSNDSGFAGASWEAYNASKAWTLASGTGTKTVYTRFRDGTGNTSGAYNDTISVVDNTAPSGSISINSGAATTNNLNATLTLSATDDFDSAGSLEMMISNDSGFSGATWEAYAASKAWTLTGGAGVKTVYVKYKDSASNESGSYNDTITLILSDTTSPTGSISINAGAPTTNSSSVTLTLSATDDIDPSVSLQMMVSNDSGFSGASWESYATSKAWILVSGIGAKTVYAKFRDSSLNASGSYHDAITVVDTTAPTGSISINSGATSVNTSSVTLALSATDNFDAVGSLEMIVSNEFDFAGASWEAYNTSKAWTLISGTGARTVYAKFKDGNSNESSYYSSSIEVIHVPASRNNGVGNNSNPPTSTQQQNNSTEVLKNIVLNDYQEFFGDTGVKRESVEGEKLFFNLSQNASYDEHSITVQLISDDRVTVVIASEPIVLSLKIGETKLADVDKDGKNDIAITLQSITARKASMLFRRLGVTNIPKQSTYNKPESSNNKSYIIWIVAGVIGIGLVVFFIIRKMIKPNLIKFE